MLSKFRTLRADETLNAQSVRSFEHSERSKFRTLWADETSNARSVQTFKHWAFELSNAECSKLWMLGAFKSLKACRLQFFLNMAALIRPGKIRIEKKSPSGTHKKEFLKDRTSYTSKFIQCTKKTILEMIIILLLKKYIIIYIYTVDLLISLQKSFLRSE